VDVGQVTEERDREGDDAENSDREEGGAVAVPVGGECEHDREQRERDRRPSMIAPGADGLDRRRAGGHVHVVKRGELRDDDQKRAEDGRENDGQDRDGGALARLWLGR
jgi:hypothetical protein